MKPPPSLYTVGHSTHSLETFLGLLGRHQITTVGDIRSFPASRRWPHFNQSELQLSLEAAGMAYLWFNSLGGRRHSKRAGSPHTAWEQPAFRAYADYCETPEFEAGLGELIKTALQTRLVIMCSEGLWWRCHRRIVSDYMVVRGWRVTHILPDGKLVLHALSLFATARGGRIVYDGGQSSLGLK